MLNNKSPKQNISNTTGKVRSVQKVGRFMFAEMQAAFAIHIGIPALELRIIPALELRIRLHELDTCGNITFTSHTHWLCNWVSGGACLVRGGKSTTWMPRIVGHRTESVSEMPGTCTDRRSSNARPSDQPPRARPNRGEAVPIEFQWG